MARRLLVRSVIFAVFVAMVYLLLRGFPEGWHLWLRFALAGSLLVLGLLIWRGKDKSKENRFSSNRKPRALDYLVAVAVIGLIEVLSTTVLVTVSQSEVFSPIGLLSSRERGASAEPGAESGDRLWDDSFERELAKSSDHKLKSHPEVYLEILNDAGGKQPDIDRVYLRGFTFSLFDGDKWKAANRFKKVLESKGQLVLSERDSTRPVVRQRITIKTKESGQNLLLAMPGARTVELEKLVQVANGIYLLPTVGEEIYSYVVESQPWNERDLVKLDPHFEIGESGDENLAVPQQIANDPRVLNLLKGVDKSAPVADKLSAVRELLNSRCDYSLKVKNSRGVGSMENFLFDERVGYCEHFASAAALLCRKLGVPSRVAFGYSGGVFYAKQGIRVFRASDAHAWTEIFVKGHGWVVFDTTPAAETAMQIASKSEIAPSLDIAELQPVPEPSESENYTWWFIPVAGILFLGVIGVSQWKSRGEMTAVKSMHPRPQSPYMQELQQFCKRAGVRQVETKTVRELVGMLPDSIELNDLADYHNAVTYQEEKTDSERERKFIAQLKDLSDSIENR